MRRLTPDPLDDIDPRLVLAAPARPSPAARPWVLANMISSVDGAATVDGRSGGLAGAADKLIFTALRSLPDAILVGASTVRMEGYGPARPGPEVQEERLARGQQPVPPIAVLSGSLSLDWESAFFREASSRPMVITHARADPERRARGEEVADLILAGDGRVDLAAALAQLAGRGILTLLCEGGPSLIGQLMAADLLDELNVTLTPSLVGGDARRIATGPAPPEPRGLVLAHLLLEDDQLFARYVREGAPTS